MAKSALDEFDIEMQRPILQEVSIDLIDPDPNQDRDVTYEKYAHLLGGMEYRIKKGKIPNVSPMILVRNGRRFEIDDGGCRFAAAKHLEYKGPMLAMVYDHLDDTEKSDIMLIANFQNKLNVIELADAVKRRLDQKTNSRYEVAQMLGLLKKDGSVDDSKFSRLLAVSKLPDDVKEVGRMEIRKDPVFLIDLARLPEKERGNAIKDLRNEEFDIDLFKERVKEIKSESKKPKKEEDKKARKSKKTSLHVKVIRRIVSDSPVLKKRMRQLNGKYKKMDDGDYNELFQQMIELYMQEASQSESIDIDEHYEESEELEEMA